MIAKFSTKNSVMDYFRYVRSNALLMIAVGIVFGIAGLAAGIAMLAVAGNVPGGTVILIVGILIATGLIVYGMYGLKRQFLKNTLITLLETNITEFSEDTIKITHSGEGIRAEKEYGYLHVARVIEDDESFQVELNNNTLVLCTKQSLIEGNEEDLESFLNQKLGKKFISRCKFKKIEKEASVDEVTYDAVNDDNISDNQEIIDNKTIKNSEANSEIDNNVIESTDTCINNDDTGNKDNKN